MSETERTAKDVYREALQNEGRIALEDFRFLYDTHCGYVMSTGHKFSEVLQGLRIIMSDAQLPIVDVQNLLDMQP